MEVDDVLRQGIQGISELITEPGLINLDFADVKTIMSDSGGALMAIGRGTGESRAQDAARMAISSPLLDISMDGARGVLLNITGGNDLALSEISEAADVVAQAADPEASIIFGAVDRSRAWRTRCGSRSLPRASTSPSGRSARATSAGDWGGRRTARRARRAQQPVSEQQQPATRPPVEERDRDRPPERDTGPIRVGTIGSTLPEPVFGDQDDDLDIPPFLRGRKR